MCDFVFKKIKSFHNFHLTCDEVNDELASDDDFSCHFHVDSNDCCDVEDHHHVHLSLVIVASFALAMV